VAGAFNGSGRRSKCKPNLKNHTGLGSYRSIRVNVEPDQMVTETIPQSIDARRLGRILFYDWRYLARRKKPKIPNSS